MRLQGILAGVVLALLGSSALATAEEDYLTEAEINRVIGHLALDWNQVYQLGLACLDGSEGYESACQDYIDLRNQGLLQLERLKVILDANPNLKQHEIDAAGIREISMNVQRTEPLQKKIGKQKKGGPSLFHLSIIGLSIVLYLWPGILANRKKKRNATAIMVLNVFLGWTFVGWVVALVWACMKDDPPPRLEPA